MLRLDGPRMPPANGGAAKKLVILAHGYGSNGDDLIGLGSYLARALPDAVFVAPNGPEPVPGHPGGYQWFPIARLDPHLMGGGVRSAAPSLDRFIDAELARYRLAPADCAVIGFSQGTMMALHVSLRRPEPLGAVIGYSGMLAAPETLAAEVKSRPPIALVHGDRDDVIPVAGLFVTLQGLAAAGVPALWRISPGGGHTIAEDALALGGAFLREALMGRFRGWAPPEPVRRA